MHRFMFGLLVAGILAAGAGYCYKTVFNYNFLTVTPGQVYQSGAMPPAILENKIQKYGIRAVIDLRSPGDDVDQEHATLAQLGVEHFHIPSGQVPEVAVVDEFLEIMDRCENRPVLIHCNHGEGRAVLFTAIYRMEYEGWNNEHARRVAYWQSGLGNFNPNSRKGRFLSNYIPRWRVAPKIAKMTK